MHCQPSKRYSQYDLLTDLAKIRRILSVRSEVEKEWRDARDCLAIGRALLSLEETLSRAEFIRLRQAQNDYFRFLKRLPPNFDKSPEPSIRSVATGSMPRIIRNGISDYLLTENQLRAAQERGLIRSDVTRREIMQLRREVRVMILRADRLDGLTAQRCGTSESA